MARKIKFKTNWKKILCAILAAILCITAIGGIAALAKDETKSISSTEFTRGALDENGKYVESDQSIYTKEAFGCNGLRIEPDFEADATYDIYYYNNNGVVLKKITGLSGVYDEDYPYAKAARVVIHPKLPDDVDKDEFKIAFYEVYSLANKFDITVSKDQKYRYADSVNLYDSTKAIEGYSIGSETGVSSITTLVESANCKASNLIKVTGEYEYYDILLLSKEPLLNCLNAAFGDADGNVLKASWAQFVDVADLKVGEWTIITLEVPDSDEIANLRVSFPKNCTVEIYGYND